MIECSLQACLITVYYPNLVAVAKHISVGNTAHESQTCANACCAPAYFYFKAKFDNDLRSHLLAFKVACYFSPLKVNELKPTAADIDSLSVFPFLNSELIASLKHELPDYLAEAEVVSEQVDALRWWKSHEENCATGLKRVNWYC